jgi:hypothetical protein
MRGLPGFLPTFAEALSLEFYAYREEIIAKTSSWALGRRLSLDGVDSVLGRLHHWLRLVGPDQG